MFISNCYETLGFIFNPEYIITNRGGFMKRLLFFLCSILFLISFTACQNALSSDLDNSGELEINSIPTENGVNNIPTKVPEPPD